jgi:hypothetical protein
VPAGASPFHSIGDKNGGRKKNFSKTAKKEERGQTMEEEKQRDRFADIGEALEQLPPDVVAVIRKIIFLAESGLE